MKILYYFAEENSFMFQWQRIHIFDELKQHGIEIEVYNPLHSIDILNDYQRFETELKNNHEYDMFMSCVYDNFITKAHTDLVKSYGIPSLLICFDNLHEPFLHKKMAKEFDLVWLTSNETDYLFRKWGCHNMIFQPYAANPYAFSPKTHCKTKTNAVCFVGTPYGSRINKINKLIESNVEVNLFSSAKVEKKDNRTDTIGSWVNEKNTLSKVLPYLSFPIGRKTIYAAFVNRLLKTPPVISESNCLHRFPSVGFDDLIRIYGETSLSLNITELRNTYVLKKPLHKIHLRTFEIPMAGGLEICSYTPELANYFEDNKEIIMYRSEDEFIEKAKFYTDAKNDSLVDTLKRNARNRMLADHTWFKRFERVFENLSLQK